MKTKLWVVWLAKPWSAPAMLPPLLFLFLQGHPIIYAKALPNDPISHKAVIIKGCYDDTRRCSAFWNLQGSGGCNRGVVKNFYQCFTFSQIQKEASWLSVTILIINDIFWCLPQNDILHREIRAILQAAGSFQGLFLGSSVPRSLHWT